jgi:Holliday junction resolvase RusA-like endonuclease
MRIQFEIPGRVVGKGRPHFVRSTGVAFTPQKTRSYESLVRDVAFPLMKGEKPWEGCVRVYLVAYYKIPKSWTKKQKELALSGKTPPGKPDGDNILKIICDSVNRVVFLDDSQCTECTVMKRWAEEDYLQVSMEKI